VQAVDSASSNVSHNADGTTTTTNTVVKQKADGTTETTTHTVTTNPDGSLPIVLNNDASLSQLYRKVLQIGFDVSGTSMSLADAGAIYALYKEQQKIWAKRALLATKLGDPYVSTSLRTTLIAEFEALDWTLIELKTMGGSYEVMFAEGASCQFTNWVIGNYTDFSFNLIQREPLA
jgi:hypothetical protein